MSRRLISAVIVLVVAAGLAAYFAVHQLLVPGEVAMHISAGDYIMDGLRPYLGFLDNSAPLTLYLFAIPAAISRLFYFHPIAVFNQLIVLLGLAVSLMLVTAARSDFYARRFLFYLPLIVATLAAVEIYYLYEFGQLSMVYMLLVLPYLCERYLSGNGRPLKHLGLAYWRKIAAGLFAAVATLLDPVLALTLLVIEFICLSALGDISATKLKKRYMAVELIACLAATCLISLTIYVMAPEVVQEYFGPVTQLNMLSYQFFNDTLAYVDKSPDRRDLVYAFVFFVVLALPVAARCLLTRLFCAVATMGFVYYVCTGSLFTHQSILMVGMSALAFVLACARYLHQWQLYTHLKLPGPSMRSMTFTSKASLLVLSLAPVLAFSATAVNSLRSIDRAKFFDLNTIGYYGFGSRADLGFFSDSLEQNSKVNETVWIYSDQIRPGYPVLTQLHRRPGRLLWGYPFHPLRILRERGTPDQVAQMKGFTSRLDTRLRSELEGSQPPEMVLIEDGEIQTCFKDAGIWPIFEQNYSLLESCSPLNDAEIANHRPYEYLGYRVCFTTLKLNRVLRQSQN